MFQDIWKKLNRYPIHRKVTNIIINNYIPVCYCQFMEKCLERLIFNSLFEYLEKYKLLSIWFSSKLFLCRSTAVHCL